MPLDEKELRDQYGKDDQAKLDEKVDDLEKDPPQDGSAYKFKRTFVNNEVLEIMVDLLQAKKLSAEK